jgi:hypothetical protein
MGALQAGGVRLGRLEVIREPIPFPFAEGTFDVA